MTAQLIKDFSSELRTILPTATVRPALGKDYSLPAAVYSVRNGMRDLFYVNSYGLRTTELTVTIYAKTYEELQDLKELLVNRFHGFSGTLGITTISKSAVTNVLDGFDTALETIHRSTIIIEVHD